MNRKYEPPTLFSDVSGIPKDVVQKIIEGNRQRAQVMRAIERTGSRLSRRISELERLSRERRR